jgi:hypothetical protein
MTENATRLDRPMLRARQANDHYDGTRFFNPGIATTKSFADFLRWRFTRKPTLWPERLADDDPPLPPPIRAGECAVTFIGHATLLLRFPGLAVLTDPAFSERASPSTGWAQDGCGRPPLRWKIYRRSTSYS